MTNRSEFRNCRIESIILIYDQKSDFYPNLTVSLGALATMRQAKLQRVGNPRNAHHKAGMCRKILLAGQGLRYAGVELQLRDVSWSQAPPGFRVRPHRHSCYEALLTVSGEGIDSSRGHQRIVPGLVQLHPPGSGHGWTGTEMPLERFAFHFTLPSQLPLRRVQEWPVVPEALDRLSEVAAETRTNAPGHLERIQARFLLLVAHFLDLLDWSAHAGKAASPRLPGLADAVDSFLEDNVDAPIGLLEVALFAGVSVPTLVRCYRAERGATVIDRLSELRMEKATMLLRDTDQAVNDIARRSGFAATSYFCRRFREHYDCTPLQYRRSFQDRD